MSRRKASPKPTGFDPMVVALAGLLAIASFSAYRTYHHTAVVQETIQSGEGLCLIITDKGIKSDSAKDEAALSSATQGLVNAQNESLVLAVACGGIALALGIRIWRQARKHPHYTQRRRGLKL